MFYRRSPLVLFDILLNQKGPITNNQKPQIRIDQHYFTQKRIINQRQVEEFFVRFNSLPQSHRMWHRYLPQCHAIGRP